jgi:hypothetical protein
MGENLTQKTQKTQRKYGETRNYGLNGLLYVRGDGEHINHGCTRINADEILGGNKLEHCFMIPLSPSGTPPKLGGELVTTAGCGLLSI